MMKNLKSILLLLILVPFFISFIAPYQAMADQALDDLRSASIRIISATPESGTTFKGRFVEIELVVSYSYKGEGYAEISATIGSPEGGKMFPGVIINKGSGTVLLSNRFSAQNIIQEAQQNEDLTITLYLARPYEEYGSIGKDFSTRVYYNVYPGQDPVIAPAKLSNPQIKDHFLLNPEHDMFTTPETLIITSEDLVGPLLPLAEWKTQRGTPSAIYTTYWINQHYQGDDLQEKIKNFVNKKYEEDGIKYLILGGTNNKVPGRLIIRDDCYGDFISDYYYSDLSNWDARPDYTAEIAVGRLPASTPEEMEIMVEKGLHYEKNPPAGTWIKTALLTGAINEYSKDDGTIVSPRNDSSVYLNYISEYLFPANYNRISLYEKNGILPAELDCTCPLSSKNVGKYLNKGAALWSIASHGRRAQLYSKVWVKDWDDDGLLDTKGPRHKRENRLDSLYEHTFFSKLDIQHLENNGMLPFVFSSSCYSGDYSFKPGCLGEALLTNPHGGAIGFIGASRASYSSADFTPDNIFKAYSRTLQWLFWKGLFAPSIANFRPGDALAYSKNTYVENLSTSALYSQFGGYNETITMFNLLGDPEIPLWTDNPGKFAIAINQQQGELEIVITNKDDKAIKDALVCLQIGDEVYLRERSNARGCVNFDTIPGNASGSLVITKHNYVPFVASIINDRDGVKVMTDTN